MLKKETWNESAVVNILSRERTLRCTFVFITVLNCVISNPGKGICNLDYVDLAL